LKASPFHRRNKIGMNTICEKNDGFHELEEERANVKVD